MTRGEGWEFRWISTLGYGAFGMHSGAWEERAHEICFYFALPQSFFKD